MLKVDGLGSNPATIHFDNSEIDFTAAGNPYTIPVPNADITFSPSATLATTVFNTVTNTWETTLPSSGLAGNDFLDGVAFQVPVDLPGGINPVTWSGDFSSDTSGLTIHWQWAAAVVLAAGVLWNFGLDDGRSHERTNMAVYLIEQQRFDEAARLIDDTERITRDPVTLHGRSAEAYKTMAIALVQAGQPEKALAGFTYAHRYDPNDAGNLLNIPVIQAQRRDLAAARRNAQEALRLRPGYPQAEGLLRAIGERPSRPQ